jgi:hypothetical protein
MGSQVIYRAVAVIAAKKAQVELTLHFSHFGLERLQIS